MSTYTIGIDYGTNSVRALIVDTANGNELASAVFNYPGGHQGVWVDANDPHLARQHPGDYVAGLLETVRAAIAKAATVDGFSPDKVIGIGVDTTGSTPIPVTAENVAIGMLPQWRDNPAAQAWLWKDHTSYAEAARITELAAVHRPQYIAKCGNTYSSEWFWSKIWHCLNTAPEVFAAAYSWVELSDWVPSLLVGVTDPTAIKRGVCAAGHKALYCAEWDGLPDEAFLRLLDPMLAQLRSRLYDKAYDASTRAGELSPEWAAKLGLPAGIPVAIGEMDVHYGAIGCGIAEGTLVKVIGTSTCDCLVVPNQNKIADIPGICGIVDGAILPGFYGIEAGQSAVGDIFKWWVEGVCGGDDSLHAMLSAKVNQQRPGQHGLLALDWNNGNRTILVDPMLSGLIIGTTLHTTQAEIYRALIEATAFGARAIIERIKEYGVAVNTIVCAGGIAKKDPFLMQVYADVTGCDLRVAGSSQACALGAAVAAAVVAGSSAGGYDDFPSAQAAMTRIEAVVYRPIPENQAIYNQLYALYRQLHDAFGGVTRNADLSMVMKQLIAIRKSA